MTEDTTKDATDGDGGDGDGRTDAEHHPDDGRRHEPLPDPAWPVVESNAEYETGWFVGGYDEVEQPNGSHKRYYWAELATAVVVVARAGDEVIFVEQYRPTIRETQLELPAGIVEAGESYTAAAERELREETGLDPSSTALIQELWCSTGLLRHRRGFVYADGLEPVEQDLDDNEFLTVRSVPVDDVREVARRQPTNDATVEGVLLAQADELL